MNRSRLEPCDVFGDRRVLNVAAVAIINAAISVVGRIGKLSRSDDLAVDPAADVLVRRHEAKRRDVADGKIQHQAAAAVRAAAGGLRGVDRRRALVGVELRLIGHQLDGAAHGSRAVQGALGAAQDLGVIEIVEVGVDDRAAVERHGGCRQGGFVDVEADGRHGTAGGTQAAHFILGLARAGRAQRDSGDGADQILYRPDVLLGQVARAQRAHADRRGLHGGVALLGGDDDLLQIIAARRRGFAGGRSRRAGRGGIGDGRAAHPSDAENGDQRNHARRQGRLRDAFYFHYPILPE